MVRHIFLSPHLDDAIFSCGGLIAHQAGLGAGVTVMTLCAGDPQPGQLSPLAEGLHARWGNSVAPVAVRRAEDRIACGRLGASVVHLGLPDAVYRHDAQGLPLYPDEESIFGKLKPADDLALQTAMDLIRPFIRSEERLYSPLGVGGHVDHQLTRRAAEGLGTPVWYYMDMPYAGRGAALPVGLESPTGRRLTQPLAEEEIEAWANAAFEYASQRSTFWSNYEVLFQELRDYHDSNQGVPLIAPPQSILLAEP